MSGFNHGYARHQCFICDDGVWHQGGEAQLDKHTATNHPGRVPSGEVRIFDRPSPAGVVYGGGKR